MPAGKLAAQAGHAYLESYLAALDAAPERAAAYRGAGIGTKIALAAPDEPTLRELCRLVYELELPAALIIDEGHVLPPHFDGSPVVTALGIGPATREEVRRLLRRYPLL